MTVTVANSAGFCFGVKRAVSMVYEEAEKGGAVHTLGPIIHNETVVEDLARRGVRILDEHPDAWAHGELGSDDTVIIRSHGISREMHERLARTGCKIVDATCPFVRKIHDIVCEQSKQGFSIVIIGNPDHPEVRGIQGWAEGPCAVVENAEDIASLSLDPEKPVCVTAQTTFNFHKFQELVEIIKGLGYHVVVTNTICNATRERQKEALELATASDVMLVIGGKHSSNTQKLFDICRSQCSRSYFVSVPEDLKQISFGKEDRIGITAGASTPNTLIQEVSLHVRRAEL